MPTYEELQSTHGADGAVHSYDENLFMKPLEIYIYIYVYIYIYIYILIFEWEGAGRVEKLIELKSG